MTWRDVPVAEQRYELVRRYGAGESMTALCLEYGVSRKTGHKWLQRYDEGGRTSLADRSRAPRSHPNQTSTQVEELLLSLRRKRPTWGAKKLLAVLGRARPDLCLPAVSTAGDILDRNGLVTARRPRARAEPYSRPFQECTAPNDLWCMDFKGHFTTQDQRVCHPMTISDAFSRMLLRCHAVGRCDEPHVRDVLESAFTEYGLPRAIRTDNGPPFASSAPAGLSKLAVWLMKLGVTPERIAAGKPQQNGRHERMHRTLLEVCQPPARTANAQQRAFDRFRADFNHCRPHEALGQRYPIELFTNSARRFPCPLQEPRYPSDCELRRVRSDGSIKWMQKLHHLSAALVHEQVAFFRHDDHHWLVRYADIDLGFFSPDRGFQKAPSGPNFRRSSRTKV
jgi:transposase InsO family protein